MKILLVEDESKVRTYIKKLLTEKGYCEVIEADNGQKALSLLQKQGADIIISDIMMPVMDGITLLSKVRETGSENSVFIILSAYDSFQNAQKAISYGAFSYLLKPIKDEELLNVITLAETQIHSDRLARESSRELKDQYRESLKILQKNFLSSLIVNPVSQTGYISSQMKKLNISFLKDEFIIILGFIENKEALAEIQILKDLKNIVTGSLTDNDNDLYFFDYQDGFGFLLNMGSENVENYVDSLKSKLLRVKRMIKSRLDINATLTIGSVVDSIESFNTSYNAALNAMAQRLVSGDGVYCDDGDKSERPGNLILDFDTERKLLRSFEKEDSEEAYQTIKGLYKSIAISSSLNIENLKNLNYQLLILIFKIARKIKLNPEKILGDEYLLYREVNEKSNINEMVIWFEKLAGICFKNLSEILHNSPVSSIYKAKDYIDSKYGEDISLESVASHIFMSPEHFSREFKKTVGDTYINYLSQLRISKAGELLSTTNIQISRISAMVGFSNTKYFSKVFKSSTGHTPSKYRLLFGHSE